MRFVLGAALGLVVICGGAYTADCLINKDKVPRGVTVGGVEIGGMEHAAAVEKLQQELGDVTQKPVIIHAGELESNLIPAESGLNIDWDATVDGAGKQSMNPLTRLGSFFHTHEIETASSVDEAQLESVVSRISEELSPAPVDAGINLNGGKVNVDPQPHNGQIVEGEVLKEAIAANWLNPEGVTVEAAVTEPEIGQEAVDKVLAGDATAAVAGDIVVHGQDGIDGIIPTSRMGEVVSFKPEGHTFLTEINAAAAQNILKENLEQTEVAKKNARIAFDGDSRTITPHTDGISIDWEKTMDGFAGRVVGSAERTFDAVYVPQPATFTTEMAKTATFDDVIGEFTTSGYSQASGVNIATVAQTVNDAVVAPGDIFSLNNYTGARGSAQGYVESGIILNGRADTAVGGGISQFATTLYNAAYFAGMEDVAHTPHSYYISRYPAGREATVFEGAIDLQFRNTSPFPVRIVTSVGGGSVTVKLMGVKTVEVESINGGRWAYTDPQTMNVSDEKCSPSSGAQGFTTSDTRIIRDLGGQELSRETQTTVYDPQPIVRCS
ncbi:hypothetical protein EML15_05240 [Corynebacterium sp. sy017]|nr:VanW family protein [Corynebacterium sp. sy017]MBP3088550.1 hypothetical protein [Corynebacterium sp. sy017]QDZ43467.1 hypothetical protein FQV43_01360 [Corynebacterium sp. sy039]TSD92097.1 hypothetical protein ELY17_05240 [Corynebacterium sp. SY003]